MALLGWWSNKMLSDVTKGSCQRYARSRVTEAAARRELEDMRAAIIYHTDEGYCSERIKVYLPEVMSCPTW